jgi:hypothetical protein
MSHYDFVTVGNYTKDTIVSAAGTRHVDGGGYNYAAHAAALAGLKVAVVTRRSRNDAGVTAPLMAAGIDVYAFDSPSSTLMRLEVGIRRGNGEGEVEGADFDAAEIGLAAIRIERGDDNPRILDKVDQLMDMLLAKKRSKDRREWLEAKGDLAEV